MKNLLVGLLAFANITAFAGELVNTQTNEKLVFAVAYNSQNGTGELKIDSTVESFPSRTVVLGSVFRSKEEMNSVQKAKSKADYQTLEKAILSDEEVEANNSRFNRVIKILKKAIIKA